MSAPREPIDWAILWEFATTHDVEYQTLEWTTHLHDAVLPDAVEEQQ